MAARKRWSDFEDLVTGLIRLLRNTPTWLGPLFAAFAFVLPRFVAPLLMPSPKPGAFDRNTLFVPLLHMLAWLVPAVMLAAWVEWDRGASDYFGYNNLYFR